MHICHISHISTCFSLQGILQGCNQMCAGYLFQQDKQYDVSYDTGDKAIQCGRHVDIFKFWLMWKAKVNNKSSAQKSEIHIFNLSHVTIHLFKHKYLYNYNL